jgi:hypothetical protein
LRFNPPVHARSNAEEGYHALKSISAAPKLLHAHMKQVGEMKSTVSNGGTP